MFVIWVLSARNNIENVDRTKMHHKTQAFCCNLKFIPKPGISFLSILTSSIIYLPVHLAIYYAMITIGSLQIYLQLYIYIALSGSYHKHVQHVQPCLSEKIYDFTVTV